ncbi:alpha/beta hydrolase [Mycolicibacterium sp.]|uniref:alpha/beta hydrolase n=1 Tax=Mycolicibacterium sp. TaxID=2320850 RepID=UPI0037C5A11B
MDRGPEMTVCDVVLAVEDPDGEIRLRIYHPGSPGEVLPTLCYFHGGGFIMGSLDGVDSLCRTLAASAHCVAVSVDYRLSPEYPYPTPALDCAAAVQWVVNHIGRFGGDPAVVALGGDSAGATLALSVAIRNLGSPSALAALVLAYPAVDVSFSAPSWRIYADAPLITVDDAKWTWSLYLRNEADWVDPLAVPNMAPDLSRLPDTFILTAEVDVLRDDAEAFAGRLAGEGVITTARRYAGVYHGFFTEIGVFQATVKAVGDAAAFLRNVFHGAARVDGNHPNVTVER